MATLLGKEIIDKCLCGERVELYQRQELVYDAKELVWKRVCAKCINGASDECLATFQTQSP